jgi:hypothetical protein
MELTIVKDVCRVFLEVAVFGDGEKVLCGRNAG